MSSAPASDILSTYTNDIARHALLTADQERSLGAKARAGDTKAQEAIVNANLRFVVSIVMKRYRHHGVPIMDLIQAGNMGLMHAAKKFDPNAGVRFISYAIYWIAQQIQKEIDGSNGSVRATPTQMVRVRRVRKLQTAARQHGRELSVGEIQKETGYTAARINEATDYRVAIKSLDEPVSGEDGASTTFAQVLGFEDGSEERERRQEVSETVRRVLCEVLSPRERQLLSEYFGFGGKRELSLTEIGEMRGVSRERVRQIKERALRKLRNATAQHPALRDVFLVAKETADHAPIAHEAGDEDLATPAPTALRGVPDVTETAPKTAAKPRVRKRAVQTELLIAR